MIICNRKQKFDLSSIKSSFKRKFAIEANKIENSLKSLIK